MKSHIKREMLRISIDEEILDQFNKFCNEHYLKLKYNIFEILMLTLMENEVDKMKVLDDVSYRSLKNLIIECSRSKRSMRTMRSDIRKSKQQ